MSTITMSIPAGELQRDLMKIAEKLTEGEVIILQRTVTLQAMNGFVLKTPTDTGRARGGWTLEVGTEPPTVENRKKDRAGGYTLTLAENRLRVLTAYNVIYIVNDVPYIAVLDQGTYVPSDPGPSKDKRRSRKGKTLVSGGFSVQAPTGMVDVTLQEIRAGLTIGGAV